MLNSLVVRGRERIRRGKREMAGLSRRHTGALTVVGERWWLGQDERRGAAGAPMQVVQVVRRMGEEKRLKEGEGNSRGVCW